VSESVRETTMGMEHAAVLEASPYGIQSKKLTMWLFIASDAVTFAALLVGYGFLRTGSLNWTTPFEFSPTIVNGLVMTFIRLTSSLTMLAAVGAAKVDDRPKVFRWLGVTMLLGAIFAALHLREWFKMFHEGWSLHANPMGGDPQFGAAFFSITGLHLLHVISGVLALAVIALGYSSKRLDANHVETTGLYWHFVDIVWMFVFPLLYLLNTR
jgi:cytochrome c oxidase subunit 3